MTQIYVMPLWAEWLVGVMVILLVLSVVVQCADLADSLRRKR